MKKKLKNKLVFNKTTVANLNNVEQNLVRGGATDPLSCASEWPTYCNTECGQNTCETCVTDCYPCWTERPIQCTEAYTICDKPCVP